MGAARDRVATVLPPAQAFDLWIDTARWPTWVDGFARVERKQEGWPAPDAKLVWQSRPGGRGTVTEKVVSIEPPHRIVSSVFDDQLSGRQTVTISADEDGSDVLIELDYELNSGGPLRAVADFVFIRRALRDSIRRTLERFAVEAAEEAALADTQQ